MGSKKFPNENEFDKFINDNGGSSNACTGSERTNFFFEIQRQSFSMALDMFSQFFIDPLMVKNAMDREREAVDSEFQGYMPSDGWRLRQLFVSIAKPNHPVAKFSASNKQSLSKVQYSKKHILNDKGGAMKINLNVLSFDSQSDFYFQTYFLGR